MPRLCIFFVIAFAALAVQVPDTLKRWWADTQALSNDSMEGRDTGSEGYRRAAAYVVDQFKKAGLQSAGSSAYYQTVPLHEVRFSDKTSTIRLITPSGDKQLEWLRDITVPAALNAPTAVHSKLIFQGSDIGSIDVKNKIVVRLRAQSRPGTIVKSEQLNGTAGTLTIDGTGGPEPPRWPVAYSVVMRLLDDPLPVSQGTVAFRFNPKSADKLFEGSGHSYQELNALAESGKPLPTFALPAKLDASMHFETRDLSSDNVIAALPGSDPVLSKQYIVVSAHLDGYGFGEPWNGDRIYNGTFDDAAYVATLMDLANKLHQSGANPKRSILFCVFTGEEKGLLGSKYFTSHLTVPREALAADINLDQLRPIFPLKTLTTLAVNESSLGDTVKQIAGEMNIQIQPDPEPERNLLRRSDHWNFMQIGVPSVGFIFGYQKGSPEEGVYRGWYAQRYHSPADDLNQPWDPAAAEKFNNFFDRLVIQLANAPKRPAWSADSGFAKRAAN